jgi:hypothetical protein
VTFTRRTQIARIHDPNTKPDPSSTTADSNYIDIEILEAIAFRTHNNREVILKLDHKGSAYIKDDTGGGHQKTPGKASSKSHMKRVQSADGKNALDVEVVDCWAARDTNNKEWILDMQPGSDGGNAFNISDGTGDIRSTRRQHNETVTQPPGKTKADAKGSYITSVRSDNLAFRTTNNFEVILSCPSCDDPNAQGVDFSRASTFSSPKGYDPNDESDQAVKPPSLDDLGYIAHNYVKYVEDGGTTKGIFTQDEKIDMGPFWWIRKINQGNDLWFGFTVSDNIQGPHAWVTFDDIPELAGVQLDLMVSGGSNGNPTMPSNPAFIDTGGNVETLTDAMLNQTVLTGIHGEKVLGFGLWVFTDAINPFIGVWIKSKNPLFAQPFKVTLHTAVQELTSGDMVGTAYALSKTTSAHIKAGLQMVPDTSPGPPAFPGDVHHFPLPQGNDAGGSSATTIAGGVPNLTFQFDLTDPANPKITTV